MTVWKVNGGTIWQDLTFTWEESKPRKISLPWSLPPKLNCYIFLWAVSLSRLRDQKWGKGGSNKRGSHSLRICIWHRCESLLPKPASWGSPVSETRAFERKGRQACLGEFCLQGAIQGADPVDLTLWGHSAAVISSWQFVKKGDNAYHQNRVLLCLAWSDLCLLTCSCWSWDSCPSLALNNSSQTWLWPELWISWVRVSGVGLGIWRSLS